MSKVTLFTSELSKEDERILFAVLHCYGAEVAAVLRRHWLVLVPTELLEPFLTIMARDVVPAEAIDTFALVN